ncbi:MAG: YgiQ family radical SAM protein, partial [Firmicutes bacterium]|nr:YgiQ family radical SAM protein [Bacillota bacterium]
KKPRRQDAYSPGGQTGRRPDYAAAVYSRLAKQAFPDTPVILGGVEASMRRYAHYDYWSDSVKPSWLLEGGADLLVYGMAELTLRE